MKIPHQNIWSACQELYSSDVTFVVVTLVHVRGHAPQEMGAKIVVTREGLFWGTVGGGKVEAQAIEHARQQILNYSEGQIPAVIPPETLIWNLQRDVGMTCGGEVTFLFEVHKQARGWKIAVFGAGHVGQALVRTLLNLNCKITCVDSRAEWLEKLPVSPKLEKICVEDLKSALEQISSDSFFAVMTKGHALDFEMLEAILKRVPQPRYLGCIGSDVKTIKLRADLKAKGFATSIVEQLRCPMGLPIGTNDPYEIAVSISAEMLQVRDAPSTSSSVNI